MAITIASIDPSPDGAGIVSFAIDGPRLGERLDGDGFEIDGWVLGLRGPVVAIEVGLGNEIRCRVPVATADGAVRVRLVVIPLCAPDTVRRSVRLITALREFSMSCCKA